MTERLRVIKGSMFSGKTEELIRRAKRAEHAHMVVQVFKPIIDNRWGDRDVTRSHSGAEYPAISVNNSAEILDKIEDGVEQVFIEEVQFFDTNIVPVVEELLDRDIEVVVTGLPTDFRNEPFGEMPILLAKADNIDFLTAICTHEEEDGRICRKEATRTQRFVDGKHPRYTDPIIVIGAEESYAARCPNHHIVLEKPPRNLGK